MDRQMHGFQMILGRWSLTVLLVEIMTSFWARQLEKRARYQVRGENPAHSEGTGRFQFIRQTKPLGGPPLFWHLHSQQFRYNAPQPQPCNHYIYIYLSFNKLPRWGTDSLSAAGQDDNTSEVSQDFYREGVGTTAVERKLLRLELPGVQRAPVNLRLFQRAWNLFASQ